MNRAEKKIKPLQDRKKCLFVYTSTAPLVINDGKFLRQHFEVIPYHCVMEKSPLRLGWNLLRFSLFVVINIPRVHLIYTWFTDYHSPILTLWANLWKKPIYCVVGGYEVEHLPHLKYGGLKNPLRKAAITFSLNHSTKLLAVSQHTYQRTKAIISHDQIEIIYNGVDLDEVRLNENFQAKKKTLFLTVGNFKTEQYVKRKGIDKFIFMAEKFDDKPFMIIGLSSQLNSPILKNRPKNVTVKSFLPPEELKKYYMQTKYYLQLSELETFGVAVLEALSFGAVPIISKKGALPEIFGDCSIVVDTDRLDEEIEILKTKMRRFSVDQNKIIQLMRKYDIQHRYRQLSRVLLSKKNGRSDD